MKIKIPQPDKEASISEVATLLNNAKAKKKELQDTIDNAQELLAEADAEIAKYQTLFDDNYDELEGLPQDTNLFKARELAKLKK